MEEEEAGVETEFVASSSRLMSSKVRMGMIDGETEFFLFRIYTGP